MYQRLERKERKISFDHTTKHAHVLSTLFSDSEFVLQQLFAWLYNNPMGNSPSKQYKVFLGGLNGSGKTTSLYNIKLNQIVTSTPTIGFNVEAVTINNVSLQIWDVGGGCMIRPLFKHYFQGLSGLVYMIKCSKQSAQIEEGIDKNMEDLWKFHLQHIDVKIPILVLLNCEEMISLKSKTLEEVKKNLQETAPSRKKHIAICSALEKDGLIEGFAWLINEMTSKDKIKIAQSKS